MSSSKPPTCKTCDAPMPTTGLIRACSVCGVQSGAETRTIQDSQPSRLALFLFGLALFMWAIGNNSLGRWEPQEILILASGVLLTWLVASVKRREAVLWAKAVVLLEKGTPPRQIVWEGVARVEHNPSNNRIEFMGNDGRVADSIPCEFFGTRRRADQFTREAAAYVGCDSNESRG